MALRYMYNVKIFLLLFGCKNFHNKMPIKVLERHCYIPVKALFVTQPILKPAGRFQKWLAYFGTGWSNS